MKLKDRFEGFKTEPQKEFDWGEMEYFDRLEKALDKACEELSGLDNEYALWFNQMVDKNGLYSYREPKNEKQWKEYLLNED